MLPFRGRAGRTEASAVSGGRDIEEVRRSGVGAILDGKLDALAVRPRRLDTEGVALVPFPVWLLEMVSVSSWIVSTGLAFVVPSSISCSTIIKWHSA